MAGLVSWAGPYMALVALAAWLLPPTVSAASYTYTDAACASATPEETNSWLANWRGTNHFWRGVHLSAHNDKQAVDLIEQFQRLAGANYQVKDLFYSGGLNVIFEK